MSRLERLKKEKCSKKKYNKVYRFIFLFIMITITIGSIFLIDYRVNEVLDDDSKGNLIKSMMDIF